MSISKAKVSKLKSGQTYYRVWGTPKPNSNIVFYADKEVLSGKRKDFQNKHIINGSCGDRYFRKQSQAQKFADELNAGHWPLIIMECEYYHEQLDVMDNYFCAGGFDDYDERDDHDDNF